MPSQPKRRRQQQQQQRLTFESVDTPSSPGQEGLSSARVRFQSPRQASPNSSRAVRPIKMVQPKKPRQQTLESSLAKTNTERRSKKQSSGEDRDAEMLPFSIGNDVHVRRRQAPSPPPSSFMPKSRKVPRRVVDSDSETPVEEDIGIDDTDGEGPPRYEIARRNLSQPSKKQQQQSVASGDSTDDGDGEQNNVQSSQSLPALAARSDDSDDAPLVTPRSIARHKKDRRVFDVEEEDDDDDDDDVVQTPAKRRKLGDGPARKTISVVFSDDSDSDSPDIQLRQTTPENRASAGPDSSARKTRSSARKGHRSEKEKRMELLRRRRAGEKTLTMSDLETEEEEEGERGALYDTDSDHQALDHFEDESEPEPDVFTKKSKKKKGRLSRKQSAGGEGEAEDEDTENSQGNLASFIDDEDDTIGVPEEALYHIPLQFTSASRKPLKAHFRDAVEWLIHRRINPAFERDDEVYKTAWTRLNDEVMGLANSKFISAVWRPEFYRALKARPYFETAELGAGHLATEMEKCQACGRSGHPATWAINFKGKPYDNWTLDEIERESDSDDSDGGPDGVDYDADGNRLPPEDKQFFVGANCNSNAETAHCLLHWKPALRDWVNEFLERGGWLAPEKLAEREGMKARKRRKLADDIVEHCDQRDIIKRLFADFKHNIEMAQTKDTSRTVRGGQRYIR